MGEQSSAPRYEAYFEELMRQQQDGLKTLIGKLNDESLSEIKVQLGLYNSQNMQLLRRKSKEATVA